MNWVKFTESRSLKFIPFFLFLLMSLVATFCVPTVPMPLIVLFMIDIIVIPWIILGPTLCAKDIICKRCFCGCGEEWWEKVGRFSDWYFEDLSPALGFYGLLILTLGYLIGKPSSFGASGLQGWRIMILVLFYVVEALFVAAFVIHNLAVNKRNKIIQARLDELNLRLDEENMRPF